jgi:hypothetical protein
VSVGKEHALLSEPIHVRHGNIGAGVITSHITNAKIISQDEYDVWGRGLMFSLLCLNRRLAPYPEQKKQGRGNRVFE